MYDTIRIIDTAHAQKFAARMIRKGMWFQHVVTHVGPDKVHDFKVSSAFNFARNDAKLVVGLDWYVTKSAHND